MTPVLFINCTRSPFIDMIMSGRKTYETRTKNTLKTLLSWSLGDRFLLAETGSGVPVVRCSAVIDQVIAVYSRSYWEKYRSKTCIESGSFYDWNDDTKVKYLYRFTDVQPVEPFRLPSSCRRHGRTWAEYEERKENK